MRRRHVLKAPKLRADWSKENLYNLSREKSPFNTYLTFFQQKWRAKASTRAFHGEHIREKKWERMFKRTMPSVVPMDARYLAQRDGSEQAMGRGSGIIHPLALDDKPPRPKTTPYMNMTYYPMERRLDMAVWRALFASSARQARQFVIHGWVRVNGKKMIYPGYLLNPGDMFQVDPERVMYATGARKDETKYIHPRSAPAMEKRAMRAELERDRAGEKADKDFQALADAETDPDAPDVTVAAMESAAGAVEKAEQARKEAEQKKVTEEAAKAASEPSIESATDTTITTHKPETKPPAPVQETESPKTVRSTSADAAAKAKATITALLERTKALSENEDLSPKRKQDVRGFTSTLKKMWTITHRGRVVSNSITDDLEARLAEIIAKLEQAKNPNRTATTDPNAAAEAEFSEEQERLLQEALAKMRENPIDPTKPYATPWRPRPFMTAFAFIPRYLEVNQNVCAAVYLRHPVARPGLAEVPTPFAFDTSQLAFTWYLRRR